MGVAKARIVGSAVCACLAACALGRAWGQTEIYCTITESKVETLTNATRVTLKADGVMQGEVDRGDFWKRDGSNYEPRRLKVVPFKLPNARTKLGSFIDVSTYPISHISMSIPRESREGVGLDVEVVLYKRALVQQIRFNQGRSHNFWGAWGMYVRVNQSRDGRSLIITASSDRYRAPEEAKEETQPATTSLEVSADEDGLITVRALNCELGDVLREVAGTNGMQIAVRGGANYRATMSVSKQPADVLMRTIARAYGLSVRSVGGIYFVTEGLPTEVDSYWAAPTASFQLFNIEAPDALDLLPEFLLRYVHADVERNALIATGPPQLLDKLDSDLRVLDQPVAQIQLSAIVVEGLKEESLELASAVIFAEDHHDLAADGNTGELSYRIVPEELDDLHVRLQALEERGIIRTRLHPTIVTMSGKRAEIFLGRRQYFTFKATGRGGGQEVVLESTDVGSRIITMPWSGDGETVMIRLLVEANTVLTVNDEGLPLVASRRATGGVRVTSGDTVVFGGVVMEAPRKTKSRLGPKNLRGIGDLGRTKTRRKNVTEALVLLSARASFETSDFRPSEGTESKGGV